MCQKAESTWTPIGVDMFLAACKQTDTPFKHVSVCTLNDYDESINFSNSNVSIPSTQLYNSNNLLNTVDNISSVKTIDMIKSSCTGKKSQKNVTIGAKNNTIAVCKQNTQTVGSQRNMPSNLSCNSLYNGKKISKFFPVPQSTGVQSNDIPDTKSLVLLLLTQNQIMLDRLKSQDNKIDQLIKEVKEVKKVRGSN
ncbi:hypothetical protein BmR1_04g05985 [Babesia microti strain RI]|uniref:Uncharacterized protein n=1 Tax=Babesia microti (strain RI) TaxID=1133968 RepID=I7JCR3_BABMR|nr:hypothetical protein BmR1_04g05985 [Babesia microti strain RI]CCF75395.1 hypothetical protein BmR1_04g05985 [Babesia microti strain RI]|eukprot:XP_012649803.1 hypothetical protein BmR1_04g05985 [Babesia microti strain RI]